MKKNHKRSTAIFSILFCLIGLCELGLFAKTRYHYANTQINDWGLSFQEKNRVPVGNATKEFLSAYDACFYMETKEKILYLTFDAGYDNGCIDGILDTLKKTDVKAMFFVVGDFIKTSPKVIQRMKKDGHMICNHTLHHTDMTKESKENFSEEIRGNERLLKEICGVEMDRFYRPPAGRFSEENLLWAKSLGYKTVFWSVAYADWDESNQPLELDAMNLLMGRIHPGAVILLHSTSQTNEKILDRFIQSAKNEGYTFALLDNRGKK